MIERAKPQKAGLRISPICCLLIWKSTQSASTMSPRIENTIEVVRRARQLATNRRLVFMP